MQYFRTMEQPQTGDITLHPGYAGLTEAARKEVDETYRNAFLNSQRLGLAIAHGMAYNAAREICEKHIGFAKLKGELEGEGKSAESAGAIAHSIGVKKYGAKAMNRAAHTHKPLGEADGDVFPKNPSYAAGTAGTSGTSGSAGKSDGEEKSTGIPNGDGAATGEEGAEGATALMASESDWKGATDDYEPGPTYEGEDPEKDAGAEEVQDKNVKAKKKDEDDDADTIKTAADILAKGQTGKNVDQKKHKAVEWASANPGGRLPESEWKGATDDYEPGPTYEQEVSEASRIKYNEDLHAGLQKHGYKRDNSWDWGGRMYRHPSKAKTLTQGGGLGNDLTWTHWDKDGKEKSGTTSYRLTKHLNKIHNGVNEEIDLLELDEKPKPAPKKKKKRSWKDDVYSDLGMKKVRGSQGGTYYESEEELGEGKIENDWHMIAHKHGYKKTGDTEKKTEYGPTTQDFASGKITQGSAIGHSTKDTYEHPNGHTLTFENHPRYGKSWRFTPKGAKQGTSGKEHTKLARTLTGAVQEDTDPSLEKARKAGDVHRGFHPPGYDPKGCEACKKHLKQRETGDTLSQLSKGRYASEFHKEEIDPTIAAAAKYISYRQECAGQGKVMSEGVKSGNQQFLYEGAAEHENFKDHTKNPYHDLLTRHGFEHKSTTHEKNRFASDNPKYDSTVHRYEHPKHGKSHVIVTQEHDPSVGHGGRKSKGHAFLLRHEQDNGIMAPSHGDSKNQLHQDLSYHYGVPKGMEAPKLTASQKKNPHIAPHYKMNEAAKYPISTAEEQHKVLHQYGYKLHGKEKPDQGSGKMHFSFAPKSKAGFRVGSEPDIYHHKSGSTAHHNGDGVQVFDKHGDKHFGRTASAKRLEQNLHILHSPVGKVTEEGNHHIKEDFDNRIRFNWGYHDGANHHHRGGDKYKNGAGAKMDKSHFDQVYTHGFHKGYEDSQAGKYDHSSHGTTTSDEAWKDSGLKNGSSLKPHKLMGKDQKGKKIAPWMKQ